MCRRRHTPHPQRRGTLAPLYSRFTNSAPHVAHRTIKPCHCEERSDVAIRTPFAPHLRPMRRGRVLPRSIRRPLPVIPCRAAPMCAAARHALHPQRRGTLAPPYSRFTNSAPHVAHRTIKPCHCEERSDVAIRTPFAPHLQPMRRGRVLPRSIRRPLPVIPCRAAPMCAAARHALHPQRRGTLAPPYRHFTNSIGNDAHIVPSARHPQ